MAIYLLTSIVMAALIGIGLMNIYNVVVTSIIAFVIIFSAMCFFWSIGAGNNPTFNLGLFFTKSTAAALFIPVAFLVPVCSFLFVALIGGYFTAPVVYVKSFISYFKPLV